MEHLIGVLSQLQEVLHQTNYSNKINLPQIVTVGAQSAGKSSVLEMIIGKDFLPRGAGIVTRRPIIIQLFNQPQNSAEWVEFGHKKSYKFTDLSTVRKELETEMVAGAGPEKGVSNIPIVMKYFSPDVVNLCLIDLPGITKIPVYGQPEDIEQRIKQMISIYINNPNSLILAISPSNYDIANSDALKLSREVDPEGQRTLGVMTKMDMAEDERAIDGLLGNTLYPLQLGYIGVRCRNQMESDQGVSLRQAIINEDQYFRQHQKYSRYYNQGKLGVKVLTNKLSEYLVEQVRKSLPLLRQKLLGLCHEKEQQLNNLSMVSQMKQFGKDSSGAVLISIINKYCKSFQNNIRGEGPANKELGGAAKINYIFDTIFTQKMHQVDPFEDLNDEEIEIAIRNVSGFSGSLIVSDKAFEMLIKRQIEKLRPPVFETLSSVFKELQRSAFRSKTVELELFDKLWTAITKNTEDILQGCYQPTEIMLQNLFFVETGYINTKNPDFVNQREMIFYRSLQDGLKVQNQKIESNKENAIWSFFTSDSDKKEDKRSRNIFDSQNQVQQKKKSEVDMIKKLIVVYFGIVKKNLIDYVPKTIVSMLVNQCVVQVENQMVGSLYREMDINSLLEKNKEVEGKFLEQQDNYNKLKSCLQIIDNFEKQI